MSRRTFNLSLFIVLLVLCAGCLYLYWVSILLSSRGTALIISRNLEGILGGRCKVGPIVLRGIDSIEIKDLVLFSPDNDGELLHLNRARVGIAFPECLYGRISVTGVVLYNPEFTIETGHSKASMVKLVGGFLKRRRGGVQVDIKAGTFTFSPFASMPSFKFKIGPVDMFLVPPEEKSAPVLRANTKFNNASLEIFGEYFTAPERLRFTFYLEGFDLAGRPGLGKALGLAFEPVGGRLTAKGSLVITSAGIEKRALVTLRQARVKTVGGRLSTIDGRFEISNDTLTIVEPGISVQVPGTGGLLVTGELTHLSDPWASLKISGKGLGARGLASLLPLGMLPPGISVEGDVCLDCTANGQLRREKLQIRLSADLSGSKFIVGSPVGAPTTIVLSGGDLLVDDNEITIHGLEGKLFGGSIDADLNIKSQAGGRSLSLGLRARGLQAARLAENLLKGPGASAFRLAFSPKGVLGGELRAAGSFPVSSSTSFRPVDWLTGADVEGRLDLNGLVLWPVGFPGGVAIQGSLHLKDRLLRFYGLRALSKKLEAVVDGVVREPFGEGGRLDLSGRLTAGAGKGLALSRFLALLRPFWDSRLVKDLSAVGGLVKLKGSCKGPLDLPGLFGELEFEDALLNVVFKGGGRPLSLDLGRGRISFDREGLWSDPGRVRTMLGLFDYRFRLDREGISLELDLPSDGNIPARKLLALFAPGRLPSGAGSARGTGERRLQDYRGGAGTGDVAAGGSGDDSALKIINAANVTASVLIEGPFDDPSVISDGFAIHLPSGTDIVGDISISSITSRRTLRADMRTKGGQGLPLSLARVLLPELDDSIISVLLKQGSLTGKMTVVGSLDHPVPRGRVRLDAGPGQTWDIKFGENLAGGEVAGIDARCTRGRLDRLLKVFSRDLAKAVDVYHPRIPFSGLVRWRSLHGGGERLAARVSLCRGAFDIPGKAGAFRTCNVRGGGLSVQMSRFTTTVHPRLDLNARLLVDPLFPEYDDSPFSLEVSKLSLQNDNLLVGELRAGLMGESVSLTGRVDRISTLGKLDLRIGPVGFPIERLAARLLPSNSGVSLKGKLLIGATAAGSLKYPSITGEITLEDVRMSTYYQKGRPLSFRRASAALTFDDLLFKPFPVKLGVSDTVFPVDGSLKKVLEVENVWSAFFHSPRLMWNRLLSYIERIDTQKVIAKAIGLKQYGKILRSSAHRIKINVFTETRREPYLYEAFLTDAETLEFKHRPGDVVRKYEELAKRGLAGREGFSSKAFGPDAYKMLRIKEIVSSVLDRNGNQVWPTEIPRWRLDRTPSRR